MLEHRYLYDRIVIGGSLDALIYANKTGSCLINNASNSIFPFDSTVHEIVVGGVKYEIGTPIIDVVQHLAHELNMKGLNPFGRSVESIRLKLEENEISIVTNFFRKQFLRFSNLHIFDTTNIHGVDLAEQKKENFRVFDWFAVRSGMKHKYKKLEDKSDFVKNIYFYISPRIDGNKDKKDLVAESIMTEAQLSDIDYSDSIVRLKVLKIMKEAGIRGSGNGTGKFLSPKIELQKREVLPVITTNYGEEGIVFNSR